MLVLQLYTGSKDETVRLWDCKSRNCLSVVEVGGQVDSLLLEGGYLFVGIRVLGMQPVPGLIKVPLLPPTAKTFSDVTSRDQKPFYVLC